MNIYMDGLERSGNVFLGYAIAMSLSTDVISKRTHDIDTLIEHTSEDPFIVPVRDAIPSIASSKIYRDKVSSERIYGTIDVSNAELVHIIDRYDNYIDYLVHNPKFFIAPFHEFTKDHQKVIEKICKQYPYLEIKRKVSYRDIENIMLKQNSTQYVEEHGNLPRPTPKKPEIEAILKMDYIKDMVRIQSNIDKLYDRYYNL